MNIFKVNVIFAGILILCTNSALSSEGHHHETEGEEITAEDYIGIYMEIPERVQQLIGMQLAQAETSTIAAKIQVNGRIPQDVENITEVYASQSGVLEECQASLGMRVEKGAVICRLASADGEESLAIEAPVSGVIVADFIRTGERVDTTSPIHTIADFSKLPVSLDVYEKDVGKIRIGQKVDIYSRAYPDEVFEGEIVFISPRIAENSFTLKVRAVVDNPDYLLKPGMFVRGEILLSTGDAHVAVPSFSVQNLDGIDVLFIQDERESFLPTAVDVSYTDGIQTLVKGDVNAGDFVVVEGAYALKSKILETEIVGGCAHGH